MHVHNTCSLREEVSQLIKSNFMLLIEINMGQNSVAELLMATSRCVVKPYTGL
jgi:hypothetical protein